MKFVSLKQMKSEVRGCMPIRAFRQESLTIIQLSSIKIDVDDWTNKSVAGYSK